ncbi:hypothetical protein [Spiroplasma endosymbiont of Notiophilus biguttatus]|uniref:hypothetical protein n=1 Tax=Spiroplasma endosymbiont of Notiophilus biguttatus TaxID=3066285 RepID=UPI00313C7CCA
MKGTMKLNEFNNAFQTEQQCLAYIENLKENKCIRCSSFNLNFWFKKNKMFEM